MKILEVTPVFYPALTFGGPVQVVYNISKELAKMGHDVTVYTTNAFDANTNFVASRKKYKLADFSVHYFRNVLRPDRLYISPSMIVTLHKEIAEFDVVHLHSWRQFQDVVTYPYLRRSRIPYVLQTHGSLPRIVEKQSLKLIYDTLFGYRLLSRASKVIAISPTEVQQYEDNGVPKDKICVIPNGIDLSEYTSLPPQGSFRKRFDIGDDERIVLYLGRIHKIKGLDILIKAFANVIKKLEHVKLVIAGPDDGFLSELRILIKTLQMEDNLLILGPLYAKDKLAAYVDADVFVLPSRYEIWGMTALETIACGTPIILTENCGAAEYLKDEAGLVVKADPDELEKAIIRMLEDEQLRAAFKKNCRKIAEKFNTPTIAIRFQEVYEGITSRPD